MKRFATMVAALLVMAASATAQTTKPDAAKAAWPEKDAYHRVMSQTFHPMEEGNFEPIKTRSQELFERANDWLNSTPPDDYKSEKIRQNIMLLARQTRELNAKINYRTEKPTDDEIKADLTRIHDTFHAIVGLCKHGYGHDHSDPNHRH